MSIKNVHSESLVLSETFFVDLTDVEKSSEELWKAFGTWYQIEREKARKTQKEVAKSANIDPKTVSRIENGEPTKRTTVIALAEALKIDVDEALQRAGFAPLNFKSITSERLAEIDADYKELVSDEAKAEADYLVGLLSREMKRIKNNDRGGESGGAGGTGSGPGGKPLNTIRLTNRDVYEEGKPELVQK